MFKKVSADGTVETVEKMSLEEIQSYVGGYVEAVNGAVAGKVVLCNDEGLLLKLPINTAFPAFFGNIVITNSKEWLD